MDGTAKKRVFSSVGLNSRDTRRRGHASHPREQSGAATVPCTTTSRALQMVSGSCQVVASMTSRVEACVGIAYGRAVALDAHLRPAVRRAEAESSRHGAGCQADPLAVLLRGAPRGPLITFGLSPRARRGAIGTPPTGHTIIFSAAQNYPRRS